MFRTRYLALGHGGRIRDDDYGEEEDGFDETLVPVDYSGT